MRMVVALAIMTAANAMGQTAEPKITVSKPPEVVAIDDAPAAKWTELKAKAGRPITLKADKPVHWLLVDDNAAALLAGDKPSDSAKLVPYGAGAHRVIGYDPTDPSNPARVVVVVGDIPNPMPPTPNPPVPVPPTPPADPLTAKLQEAFRTDTPSDVAERVNAAKDLAAFYKVAADLVKGSDADRLSDVVVLVNQTSSEMVKGRVPGCRAVLRDELKRLFPTDGALTADLKKTLEETFLRFQVVALTLPTAPTK